MKKILLSAAAFGLAVGVATTASAAFDSFSVTGYYQLDGFYQEAGLGTATGVQLVEGAGTTENPGADSAWYHDFRLYPVLKVNDKISMLADIRLASTSVWGGPDTADTSNTTTGGRIMDAHKIYMEYESPIGKFRMGRTPAGAWGSDFLNSGTNGNRLMWWPSFVPQPFSLLVFTQKAAENDAAATNLSDTDSDRYYVGGDYTTDFGKTSLAYYHSRTLSTVTATTAAIAAGNPTDMMEQQWLWFNGKYTVANFDIESEIQYQFGDFAHETTAALDTQEMDAWAAMLDVTGNFGNLSVGMLGFYASGQDQTSATYNSATMDNEAFLTNASGNGVGDDFQPYAILTGSWTGILNSDNATTGPMGGAVGPTATAYNVAAAGVKSIGIHASFDVTPELNIGGAIGAAWADEEQYLTQDDEYGVEYDLTAAYKLMDNLTYSVTFGYLDAGDFWRQGLTTAASEPRDIVVATNSLNMTF